MQSYWLNGKKVAWDDLIAIAQERGYQGEKESGLITFTTSGAAKFLRCLGGVVSDYPPTCHGCGAALTGNDRVADGCPCNSRRGINHGIVPDYVCTCQLCDPAETGSVREHPMTPA